MSHHNNQVNRNRFRSIMLSCLMLIGALSAGIPNASALTGNETISGSALTNSSTTLSLGNLDTSDTYYWWVWISDSSGTVTDFDYGGPINSNFSSMTVQSSWTTPSTSGNYTVDAELTDANLTVLDSNVVGTFSISGGSGGTGGNGSQNDAGSGGDAGDNATAAYNLTVTSGSTYAGYADQTDAQDWYRIFVPTGKGITASMSFNGVTNGTNDLDLVLIDSTVSFYIDTSYYSNPEVVNSSGTNVSGQYVYLVVNAYSGFSYYNFTVTFYNVAGGSGGITADQYEINNDVGNATSVTLPFSPGSLTIHNSSDWDVFAISMTSGVTYWMNATFTHSVGDLDIYFTDSSLNIISYSESMTDNEATSWTANNTSTYYAIVMGYAGATNTYGLTLEGGSSNVTGDVSAIFYNQTYGDLTSLNLTSGSSYDLDVHLLVPNGTSFTSVASYTDSWASNGSNHISPAYITLAEENLFCLYGELYDMSHSAGGTYVDDDMDCLYHEMMEGFVTSDTSGTIDAQNLSSGSSYSYEWYLYIGGGTTYTQSGSGNFTAGSSSQSYNINWNQPGSGSVRCFTTYLFNATSVQIGQHEDCYYPTWPGIVATGVTANSNATTNTFYFDAIDLNIGVNYAVQTSIERYSNGTVIDFSTLTNFTATSTNQSFNWAFNTPSVSGYYCAYADIWDSNNSWMGNDSICFLIIHDDDNDGVWNENDLCPNTPSNATVDIYGCAATQRDTDGDGVNDALDPFPFDGTQWQDFDGDGYGDNASGNNADAFPTDATQHSDVDGDGYGDNPNGTNADAFPNDPNEWVDSDGDGVGDNGDLMPNDASQWVDSDGDGYGDNSSGTNGDAFPTDSNQWSDSDGDGYGDNSNVTGGDLWPTDPSQWWDSDGDGYGDNSSGTNGDAFPTDGTQWSDGDGDGWGDNPNGTNPDAFPQDGTQWSDQDGDGYGDNQNGNNADAFPQDNTQWSDQDGDGYGDNPLGTNPDAFPTDGTQWADGDGDGWGDNPQGNNSDAFPTDITQWADRDGDGYGDNPQGTNPDQCPDTPSGEIVDTTGCSDTERDSDGDGVMDAVDDCLHINASGWDNDGDGCIDDTDGDGYPDPDDNCVNEDSTGHDANQDGCIDDTDGDLVKDDVDQCPTTNASGFDSDMDGCIDDTDGDLVPDNVDDCRYVDATGYDSDGDGCIDDSDGDNIKDDVDDCAYENATGFDDDQDGCIDDSDSDGVKDNNDDCINTIDVATIDNNGCSDHQRDVDEDTVKDFYDLCPNTPTGEQVNTDGCSATQRDSDGDYVFDAFDSCPGTDVGLPVNTDGCAEKQLDSDNDSIDDSIDQCDNTPANETANNYGCSKSQWDSDADTYMDSEDDCENEAGTSTVDRVGCLDSDGDGVSDLNDLFPQDASKQSAADVTEKGGFSPMVLALIGMIALFAIVAGSILVIRMRGDDSEGDQFSGALTAAPSESFADMAMAHAPVEITQQTEAPPIGAQPVGEAEPEQWVDDNGVTWHRQPDGVLLYWDGDAWVPAN